MRKFFAAFLAIAMMLSLCACGGQKDETTSTPAEENVATDTEEKENDNTSGAIEVDEGLLNVEITLPATFFEESTEEEIIAAAEEKGFSKCTINEDGSVTYKMTKAQHKEVLAELKADLDESIASMINGEDAVESFQKIEYSEDFSKFDVYVNRETYTAFDSLYVLAFYISGAYYQAFDGKDINTIDVVVNFIDNATNETFESSSYRQMVENSENAA